jgi:beta-phosphoglucomutase-like phosphatase (HAD superfamily)
MNIEKLAKYKVILWDFDGTVKESNSVKNAAFERLFQEFGDVLSKKIKRHHLENEGVSRYVKITKYMQWAGIVTTEKNISYYCDVFSELVIDKVVDCAWVNGVKKFLMDNPYNQEFILFQQHLKRKLM